LRGVTSFANDYSQNQVTIQFSYGVSTSAGQGELTPVINSRKTDSSGFALYQFAVFSGQTFTSTTSTTKVVSKTASLPASTSMILVVLQGTSVAAVSPKGQTATVTSIIIFAAKTQTSTLSAVKVESLTTRTVVNISTTALTAQTFRTTTTLVKSLTYSTVLPTLIIIISKITSVTTVLVDVSVGAGTLEVLVELTTSVDIGSVVVDKTVLIFSYVTVCVVPGGV